ncbi:multidrug effflux MFS transporter [Vibrio aestuarianus]|uniref:multidrug effflux MFS transporter n=1 Tax=Vibrio aestuarianus TaxID=28171 RepID=UPI001559A80E|nr:multidrug effflux MFS transporter [Vibrio aestuarianus]NGZ14537.1 multidrug effflux MFS transporter [Vibrio aestuarianus]NKZ50685.1 multidrug effflux MFS transporter [Vibrio aestuarianus]
MKTSPSIGLMVILMMFPQIVETIYSPALPDIARGFSVPIAVASQTLSVYFTAFALGVVTWGIVSDHLGRRTTMMLGIAIYALAAFGAMQTQQFEYLMVLRAISAFGIAVGSVVTQTMLRDCFEGASLAKVFSYMGIGLSISPVLGMAAGGLLAEWGGYQAVFMVLSMLAVILWLTCLVALAETQPKNTRKPKVLALVTVMFFDTKIWRNALLVAGFNILLFSYYLQGPFLFEKLGFGPQIFGYSGAILALGTLLGSLLNKKLLDMDASQPILLQIAASMSLCGAIGVCLLDDSLLFLLPMMLIVMGFGIGIPNILSQALKNYKAQVGSAGAWFGLLYYLLIGLGLALVGAAQHLGATLVVCALFVVIISWTMKPQT